MPTPEEIKNLIRQYAVGSATKHFSAELIESIVTGFYTSRLMYEYYIVPKEDVKELYEEHRNESRGLEKGGREWFFYAGRMDLMKSLFGSLFEEEK